MQYVNKGKIIRNFAIGVIRSVGKQKIFCVGRNNSGLTMIKDAYLQLGFVVGNQKLGEHLLHDWAVRDFRRLYLICFTAQAFQDAPFSYPFTFQALDLRFPKSKFILTTRDSPEIWYQSRIKFHTEFFGKGQLPTMSDLKTADYVYKGRMYDAIRLRFDLPENDPYNKEILIADYTAHNQAVVEYFRHRPDDLLTINVDQPDAFKTLCEFLRKI
jgi:hypothetical protein